MSSCEKNKAPCRYMPYQSYINSSAVWYKKKPVHWKCERFKYNFIEKTKINATHLPAGSISFGEVVYKNEKNLSKDTKNSYQEVLAGEYLINPLNLNFDLISLRTALSDIDVVVSTGYIVLQSRGELYSRFARWLLQQFDVSHMKTLGAGVRQTINYADIGNSIFCQPSLEEQITIAAFLDHETAKIDTLIDKQQQLIELLKEKRQAVISHAVTKGLDPDVPMKDSGVKWLGEVPEHWEIQPIKRLFKLIIKPSGVNNNHELLSVYTAIGVAPRKDLEPKGNKASSTDGYWLVRKGDIIVNKLLAWMGAVGYSEYDGVTSPAYDVLRGKVNINAKFYHYLFRSEFTQQEFKRWSRGIMEVRLRLYFDELGRIISPVPIKYEQDLIVQKIEKVEKKFIQLENLAFEQIELLKERRTALISAAVTGKIDVRDWQVPVTQTESDEVMA